MIVSLISYTQDPLTAICLAQNVMLEKDPLGFTANMSLKDRELMLEDIFKSKLQGSLEMACFVFLLEDVTRAFTHQLVRHRTGSFSQQSLRFFTADESGFRMPKLKDSLHENRIKGVVAGIMHQYKTLLEDGCPTEDARSILPTNIHTKIMCRFTYRALVDIASVRFCSKTQGEFQEIMQAIKDAINKVEPALAKHLVRACARTDECQFNSSMDTKPCPIRDARKRR